LSKEVGNLSERIINAPNSDAPGGVRKRCGSVGTSAIPI
jgi:hypothetical protein